MKEIIGSLAPEISCSQFAIGEEHYFVDQALQALRAGGEYIEFYDDIPLETGDLIFYGDLFGNPSHVAVVGESGRIISKFESDPSIYQHEFWEDPIPRSMNYETCVILRRSSM